MAFNSNELGVIRTYVAITGEAPSQEQFAAAFEKTGLNALATELLTSRPEQSNTAYVTSLYQNLLGRAPDAEGLEYWAGLLSSSAGPNQLSKARLAVEFQNSAAVNAENEEDFVDGSVGLTPVDGQFASPTDPGEEPGEPPAEITTKFVFDTETGASDVSGWDHQGFDDATGETTYMSKTSKFFNVGKEAIDQGVPTITRDYTFRVENQLGEHGHYEAFFLSPILDNVTTNLGSTLTIEVIDRMAEANNKDAALSLVAIQSVTFKLNGQDISVGSQDILNATTYEELAAAIEARIEELAATNSALNNVSVSLGADFTRQQVDANTLETTGANVLGTQIVLTATGNNVIERGGFVFGERAGVDRNVDPSGRQDTDVLGSTTDLITTNLEFQNVGYGSQGGVVNVASQSQSKIGIQQFEVLAERGTLDLGVWLTSLASNPLRDRDQNALEVINLRGNAKYFHVGQEQAAALQNQEGAVLGGKDNAGLTDVRVFNASQFNQNVKINAQVTEDVIARDLNRVDSQGNPSADNVVYSYNLGGGNNELFLSFSESVIAHEDASLSITTGGGNDKVHLVLDNDDVAPSNWYSNQKDQKNISINTGAGNDTIWTEGAGDATILAGAGNDTVYTDNSGRQGFDTTGDTVDDTFVNAHWVFNSENLEVLDLLGGEGSPLAGSSSQTGPYFLYNATLTVTLSAAQIAAAGGLTAADAVQFDNGFEATVNVPTGNNYAADERHINQAIKDAINNSPVLNKLLVAIDGPNNTLIVRSLIDGEFEATDLSVTLQNGTLPGAGAGLTQVENAYKAFLGDSGVTVVQGDLDNAVTAIEGAYEGLGAGNADLAQINTADVTGANSDVESNNVINLGSGQDVLVLGTGANSNDTIVFTGYNNGHNTVVNFVQDTDGTDGTVAASGVDFIDFTSYLTTQETSSGSTSGASVSTRAVEFEGAGALTGNTVSIITFEGADATGQQSWSNLSASNLIALLNGTGTYGDDDNTATFGAYNAGNNETAMQSGVPGAIVGNTNNHIFMVENDANDGEYKIFHVTSTRTTDGSATDGLFNTSAQLVGILDLGNSLGTNVSDMETSLVGSVEWADISGLA